MNAKRTQPRKAIPKSQTKIFVLDTNVLMHDPLSLYRFEEHDLFVPIMTLEELDANKKGMSEVARNARQAIVEGRFMDFLAKITALYPEEAARAAAGS